MVRSFGKCTDSFDYRRCRVVRLTNLTAAGAAKGEEMTKAYTLGVLGAAKIARTQIIPVINQTSGLEYWGVATRSAEKGAAFAKEVGGTYIEGYEALLANPAIDIIYNPLPNDLHVPMTLAALEAGKHVLCEKPIALNAEQTCALAAAANRYPKLKVMEAFMYRFHPQWQQVLQWINDGLIGEVRSLHAQFCYANHDPANIRNNPAAGGGALMDVGCYGISTARMIFGVEPLAVNAICLNHPTFGVDDMTHLMMKFPDGAAATVMVSTKTQRSQSVTIEGSHGRIVLSHPFYCDVGDERSVTLETDDSDQTVSFGGEINHYQLMLEAFVESIQNDSPVPLSLDDSVANMAVIDEAFASAKSEAWQPVKQFETSSAGE